MPSAVRQQRVEPAHGLYRCFDLKVAGGVTRPVQGHHTLYDLGLLAPLNKQPERFDRRIRGGVGQAVIRSIASIFITGSVTMFTGDIRPFGPPFSPVATTLTGNASSISI